MSEVMNERAVMKEQAAHACDEASWASLDAFARNSTALADIGADQAAAASFAYWQATKRELNAEETAELMESAISNSEAMKRDAFKAEFETEFRRGVAWDVLAATVPPVCILLVLWGVAEATRSTIGFGQVAICAAALLGMAILVGRIVTHRSAGPKWAVRTLGYVGRGDSSALAGSVGALAAGSLMLATGGAFLTQISKDRQSARVIAASAQLRKVDAALAMTLAAKSVNAEPTRVSALVGAATGIGWTVGGAGAADGDVLARAKLKGGQVLVRDLRASKTGGGMLQTEFALAGSPPTVQRYLYGTVLAPLGDQPSNLRQIRLRLEEGAGPALLTLPTDTLPPAPGTAILAREKSTGILDSIQPIDGVRQSLLQAAAAPAAVAPAPAK